MEKQIEERMKDNSRRIRAALLRVLKRKRGGHLGGAMSIVETLSALYTKQMRYDPSRPDASNTV